MIRIVDEIVPLTDFDGNVIKNNNPRLVKIKSINAIDLELAGKFASLNCEIRSHFFYKKKFSVRKGILPGNSKSLWKAVKIAKSSGHSIIPSNMMLNNVNVIGQNIAELFAGYFNRKVSAIVNKTIVYNTQQ